MLALCVQSVIIWCLIWLNHQTAQRRTRERMTIVSLFTKTRQFLSEQGLTACSGNLRNKTTSARCLKTFLFHKSTWGSALKKLCLEVWITEDTDEKTILYWLWEWTPPTHRKLTLISSLFVLTVYHGNHSSGWFWVDKMSPANVVLLFVLVQFQQILSEFRLSRCYISIYLVTKMCEP